MLDAEAIGELDVTATDMLAELYDELAARGIILAMARVKQNLYAQLKRSGLLEKIGVEQIYFTLHTAIAGFQNRDRDSSDAADRN